MYRMKVSNDVPECIEDGTQFSNSISNFELESSNILQVNSGTEQSIFYGNAHYISISGLWTKVHLHCCDSTFPDNNGNWELVTCLLNSDINFIWYKIVCNKDLYYIDSNGVKHDVMAPYNISGPLLNIRIGPGINSNYLSSDSIVDCNRIEQFSDTEIVQTINKFGNHDNFNIVTTIYFINPRISISSPNNKTIIYDNVIVKQANSTIVSCNDATFEFDAMCKRYIRE